MAKNIPPSLFGLLEKISKILAYAVVALEVIEFAKEKHDQISKGDYKPVNAVPDEQN